jgi:hypothetical protein
MSYESCSFKSVRDLSLSLGGADVGTLTSEQQDKFDSFINRQLRDWAWVGWWWPGTTFCEKRFYRAPYDGATTYAAPTATSASEVYFPPTQTYYQALRATTGNAPATLTAGTYVVNSAYWAVASGPYTGPDWLTATLYTPGLIVRDPADGLFKMCYLAHTSGGSLDPTKFGILTVFDPYVANAQSWETNTIGEFLGLYLDNPETEDRPRRIRYLVDSKGAHVLSTPYTHRWMGMLSCDYLVPNRVYVRFRLPKPNFRGGVFDAGATYAAATSDTIYFEGTTQDLEGDYWKCIVNTTAGQSPETTPASWQRVLFPAWLKSCVASKACADWLRYNGNRESALQEAAVGDDELFQAQLLAGAQQGQVMKWRKAS